MINTISDKKTLRKYALEKRKLMLNNGLTEINSKRIITNILNSKEFISANHIALYSPIKAEIDITSLVNVKNKRFYFPRCNNENELEFVAYTGKNSLKEGKYGILEPEGEKINPEILDIIYIPALMANKNCYRLGYGKGYYDRFFSKNKIKAKKIIVVANELISNNFIQEACDYRCDSVLSENSLIFA